MHFIPLHVHSNYRETYGFEDDDSPVAARELSRLLSLPIYRGMTQPQVRRGIDAVLDHVG